jgi:hypothetical protein
MLLVRLRSRAITEQKLAPCAFSALNVSQKGLIHVGEVVAPDCMIHGNGTDLDGERRCGRRSTVGFIGGRAPVIRAI